MQSNGAQSEWREAKVQEETLWTVESVFHMSIRVWRFEVTRVEKLKLVEISDFIDKIESLLGKTDNYF